MLTVSVTAQTDWYYNEKWEVICDVKTETNSDDTILQVITLYNTCKLNITNTGC